jgi:ADP-ribosylglycohydrolase
MDDSETTTEKLDRYRGALLGLAVGDALGTALEFTDPGPHELTEMTGGGPFGLAPGQWTDDTSMALCLAASLVERGAFDARDQMERYVRWWREGYMSSTGRCFDIGGTIRAALHRFLADGDPYAGSEDPMSAGNGSLMRLAPVPLFFAPDREQAATRAAESSRTTHAARTAVDACRYMAALIVDAVGGATKEELLAPPTDAYWEAHPLCPEIDAIARGSFIERDPPQIRGTGYVVHSLEAALWAFHRGQDFREGCLLAVNLGEDADTTGAVFGQLAGAHYGARGVPDAWLELLHDREAITRWAEQLCR